MIPLDSDSERVVHGEARIGTSTLYFADSGATGGRCLPEPSEPSHVQLWTSVDDPAATLRRALDAGANLAMDVADQGDGLLMGGFADRFGVLWWVTKRI